jgi:hypothetical protein
MGLSGEIIVGYDGSDQSHDALALGRALAKDTDIAGVVACGRA